MTVTSVPPSVDPRAASGRICPSCGSARVHRSRHRGVFEKLLSLTGLHIRRCHECNVRLLYFGHSTVHLSDLRRLYAKAAFPLALLLGVLVLAAFLLWFNGKQAVPPSTETTGFLVPQAVGALLK